MSTSLPDTSSALSSSIGHDDAEQRKPAAAEAVGPVSTITCGEIDHDASIAADDNCGVGLLVPLSRYDGRSPDALPERCAMPTGYRMHHAGMQLCLRPVYTDARTFAHFNTDWLRECL
jgi:hypothetical protein